MNFEEAKVALAEGKLVTRRGWPAGTVMVQQGGYKVQLEKWSDRTPLTKEVLSSLGITEELEIKPHYDIVNQFKAMEVGYAPDLGDITAQDWQVYSPQQQSGTATENNVGSTTGDKASGQEQETQDPVNTGADTGKSETPSQDVNASTAETTDGTGTGKQPDQQQE
jgi:hypothetical protein